VFFLRAFKRAILRMICLSVHNSVSWPIRKPLSDNAANAL
jgi:hypothetical protein